MKKLFGLVAVCALFATMAFAITGTRVRISSSESQAIINTGEYLLICDSSDTYQVDTIYTETLSLGDYKYAHFKIGVNGYTLADSANDSIIVIYQLFARSSVAPWMDTLLSADTPNAGAAIDTTKYLNDSLILTYTAFDELYWRIIVADSFIMGTGIDTTKIRMRQEVVQSEVVSR